MMKRIIILLVALLIAVVGVASGETMMSEIKDVTTDGLASTNLLTGLPVPQLPLVAEPITMSLMYRRQTNHGEFDDMWFLKQVADMTGITLKVQAIESTGWDEKVSLAFASGDYSDIFLVGITLNDAAQFGEAGMLLPLEELVAQYAPNAQKILDTLPESVKSITSGDGHIYLMPAFDTPARDMVQKIGFINEKWLENLGLQHPATADELYDCLVAVRDGDANGNGDATDEIPLSYVYKSTDYNAGTAILYAFGFAHMQHDVVNDQYVYVPMQDNFREYLKFMNRLYEDNLLDHETFTQTDAQYNAKLAEYKVFMTTPEMQSSFTEPEKALEYGLVGPLTSSASEVKTWAAQASEKPGSGSFVITDKCADPVAAIKLLDFFYSEEGSFMIKCGPENGKWDGQGGWTRNVAEDGTVSYVIDYNAGKYNSFWDFRCANGLMNMPFLYTSEHAALVLGANAWGSHLSQNVFDSGAYAARRFAYPSGVTFTADETDILAPFVLLDSYVDQMIAKFITGVTDIENDAEWQTYLSTIEAMDAQSMIQVRQEAYDRWNAR